MFEIVCNNQTFAKICKYADEHMWLYYTLNSINSFVLMYFFDLAICQKLKYKKWEIVTIALTILVGNILKLYNPLLGFIYDLWQMLIMPCVFIGICPKKWINSLVGNVLLVIFQMTSLFVRNIGIKILTGESLITTLIFSIDVFVMILLYFAYANILKKGGEKNGRNIRLVPVQ